MFAAFLTAFASVFLQITTTTGLSTSDIATEATSVMTTLFPWWQVALILALVVGLAMRVVPRIVKRMQ